MFDGYYKTLYNSPSTRYYGEKWGQIEDVIECVINLKTMEVSYIVNNTKYECAFELNQNKTYHFVFQMNWQNDLICVVSETIEYIPKKSLVFIFF